MDKIIELQRRSDLVEGFHRSLKTQEKELLTAIETIKQEIDILIKTSAILKHLLDIMVKDEINKMAGLITYGLKVVFDDQNLVFIPEITKKNEKINIELKTKGENFTGNALTSFGGSVAAVESFLLRVLCMLKKKYAKLIILDETFNPIGEEYIGNTYKLVSELCKKLGLDVLLVTQLREHYNNADNVYKVKETLNGLAMEKIK